MEQQGMGALPPEWVELAEKCAADAAAQTGVPAADWRTTIVEPVTWGDASLGLPEKGMGYAAVMMPGYRIVIEAGGATRTYHTSRTTVKFADPSRNTININRPGRPDTGGATSLGF